MEEDAVELREIVADSSSNERNDSSGEFRDEMASSEDSEQSEDGGSALEEGDVVEVDPEERALVSFFGKGATRRKCFIVTLASVGFICLLLLMVQFFATVLLSATISGGPIIVSPFPQVTANNSSRYLVPTVWLTIPNPLPDYIDSTTVHQCPQVSWQEATNYCPNDYVCNSNLNASNTCNLRQFAGVDRMVCVPFVMQKSRFDPAQLNYASFSARSAPVFAIIASATSSIVVFVSIITVLVILLVRREIYLTPPPVPVNVFQWTRSKQARDGSTVWRERFMLFSITLLIPLLLISGFLPLAFIKPSIDDLNDLNERTCYVSRAAFDTDQLTSEVKITVLTSLATLHVASLVATICCLIFGIVLVFILMALFVQRLYLVLCSKRYWVLLACIVPFALLPLIITSITS